MLPLYKLSGSRTFHWRCCKRYKHGSNNLVILVRFVEFRLVLRDVRLAGYFCVFLRVKNILMCYYMLTAFSKREKENMNKKIKKKNNTYSVHSRVVLCKLRILRTIYCARTKRKTDRGRGKVQINDDIIVSRIRRRRTDGRTRGA